MEQRLNDRHRQLLHNLSSCHECVETYKEQYESLFEDKSILPEVRIKDLQYLEELQNEWFEQP